ncbi:hypothetical protein ACE6H2_010454 [Prunus campanulata]
MARMNRPIFSNLGAFGAFGPQSNRATSLTSVEGRKVLMTLSKPDVVLANAVEGLKILWNTIRAPTFDPVEDHDTLSKIQPLLCQIAEVKPHIALACNHLERWLSKTLKHICTIKSIIPSAVDPEEILEDHCGRREGFAEAVEAAEDVLDRLEALEQEEIALKGEISADLKLKGELETKMADIRARIAASDPVVQDLTSRTFRARLASKKLASTRRALDLDMDNLSDLISTILEFIA